LRCRNTSRAKFSGGWKINGRGRLAGDVIIRITKRETNPQGGLRKAVVVRRSGAGDGAATFRCSVGVPADESMGSPHTVLRIQKNLNRSNVASNDSLRGPRRPGHVAAFYESRILYRI
jgi:hypothetical protein